MGKTDRFGRKLTVDARYDTAMKRFEKNIDKDQLEFFLDGSPDEKMGAFLVMLRDPAYATCSMSTVARKCGVTLHELQEMYSNGMRQLALLKMSEALPDIMEDVAEDAKTTMVACSRCDGIGRVPFGENGDRECPICEGDKKIRRVGDKHARDLVFESAKLTKQNGPLVAIQQNFTGSDVRMESMLKRTRQIVLEKPVIEAEVK